MEIFTLTATDILSEINSHATKILYFNHLPTTTVDNTKTFGYHQRNKMGERLDVAFTILILLKGRQNKKKQQYSTSRCPKCNASKPNLTHCIWECTKLQTFWANIRHYIHEMTGTEIPQDPYKILFHINKPGNETTTQQQDDHKEWITVCLLTAKICILRKIAKKTLHRR